MSQRLLSYLFAANSLALGLVAQPAPKSPAPETTPQVPAPKVEEPTSENLEHVKYPYRPTLIRDPFLSPSDNVDKTRSESLDEIGIRGRVVVRGKPMAIVLDSRGKTRMLPVGYRFKDGEIAAITDKAVIFRQWDPASVNRSHAKTVEKPFKREEGNR